jgi:hypothetical protein
MKPLPTQRNDLFVYIVDNELSPSSFEIKEKMALQIEEPFLFCISLKVFPGNYLWEEPSAL